MCPLSRISTDTFAIMDEGLSFLPIQIPACHLVSDHWQVLAYPWAKGDLARLPQ